MSINATPYSAEKLIWGLNDDHTREHALLLLSKMRKRNEDLGRLLWDSRDTIFLLLQEIMKAYKFLSPARLTEETANRVCNALSLIQSVAAHPNTKMKFIKANIQEYLYPFINTSSQEKPIEFLRFTSLGVVGALLNEDQTEVAKPLVEGDIIPKLIICLNVGNLLSKTMSALMLDKLLNIGDHGLDYCCVSAERFYSMSRALARAVEGLAVEPCKRLLKHVISCYVKLSQNPRALSCLRLCLPLRFRDATFHATLKDDPEAILSLKTLVATVRNSHASSAGMPFGRPNNGTLVIRSSMN